MILLINFIIILIMISTIIYYFILYTPTWVLKNKFNNKSLTWKW